MSDGGLSRLRGAGAIHGYPVGAFRQIASLEHPSAAFFWAQKMSPCADGMVVAARQGNLVDLVDAEQADSAMFSADPKIALAASAQAVGHDDHFSFWEHRVDPTVEERSDLDGIEAIVYVGRRPSRASGL